jgi:hypothetical protein
VSGPAPGEATAAASTRPLSESDAIERADSTTAATTAASAARCSTTARSTRLLSESEESERSAKRATARRSAAVGRPCSSSVVT